MDRNIHHLFGITDVNAKDLRIEVIIVVVAGVILMNFIIIISIIIIVHDRVIGTQNVWFIEGNVDIIPIRELSDASVEDEVARSILYLADFFLETDLRRFHSMASFMLADRANLDKIVRPVENRTEVY